MIGEKISPILEEIELALWEFEAHRGLKPEYTEGGFRAAIKIFMSAMMDKIWELQSDESMSMEDRINMVQKCGEDVRKIVKIYTDIDTRDLYKDKELDSEKVG
jgi:hypothetical protein